jgi:hypothetical protein
MALTDNLAQSSCRLQYSSGGWRILHVTFALIGSLGVVTEFIYWRGRWNHLEIYITTWVVAVGRLTRLVLPRE